MNAFFSSSLSPLAAVGWTLVGLAAVSGLLALARPQLFKRLAAQGGAWFDTSNVVARLDRRINVDHFFLRHCRLFGFVTLASAGVIAYFLAR